MSLEKPTATDRNAEKRDTESHIIPSSADGNYVEPPDGGWKAWFVVFGSFCGFFATQGYGYSWGVLLNYYNKHVYPDKMNDLTWIGSLWYAMCNVTGPFYVWMAAHIGDRSMLLFACVFGSLAMMLASITNQIWQLYITQGFMNGFAASLTWFSCMRGPQQWFSKRRGLAVGITMSASGIGGLCFSNILQAAIESVGHAWALRILGFMQLVLVGIAAAACLRLCPPQKNVPLVDYQDLKNKPFLLLLFIHFIGNFAFYIPSGFVPSYADYMGLNPWIGANLNAIMSAFMAIGKITLGFTSDYIGRFNMAVICGLMACVAHLAVWLTATTDASMWAFAILYGMFGGGYITMITAITAQLVGLDHVEAGTGWVFFMWLFGGLLGQPVASLIVNRTAEPDYHGAIIFAGVLFFAGACLATILRVVRGGWYPFKKV